MRELTKSMASFSWALSLFGLEQMSKLLTPGAESNSRPSLDTVTQLTERQLGSTMRSAFRTGDSLQRGMIDLMFGFLNPNAWIPRKAMDQMRAGAGGCGCGGWGSSSSGGGWGPMPPSNP